MKTMELWERVQKTDPTHVKPITGKQYSGNSPKPYYIVKRLTEEFGPCGEGWGFQVVNERFERFSETDSLHVALIEFWYSRQGNRYSFQQMGQTKASYMTNAGKFMLDEDAPKKSVTDALVKCASYLGFAGDIFLGMWDDSKYVAELRKEYAEEKRDPAVKGVAAAALTHAPIDPSRKPFLDSLAEDLKREYEEGRTPESLLDLIDKEIPDKGSDDRIYLSVVLGSEIKRKLQAVSRARHSKKEAQPA